MKESRRDIMAAIKISSKENWEKAHLKLDKAFEKEIELMREILSSLRQEELTLLEQDARKWKKVMRDRSSTVIHLKDQRDNRMSATRDLTKLAVLMEKTEMLPHEEESSCSILSKLDQVIALNERINLQNCRNDALFSQNRHKKQKPLACPYPHPLHKARRRTSVATFTEK